MHIPFNKIHYSKKEIDFIKDAIMRGHISGDGYYNNLVTSFMEDKFKTGKVFTTTSGTHALEMAVMLIEIKPEDEVIMPSFTFPSTANAVLLRGAKPVFADIEESTLNIDPNDIEKKITPKTRAIIPVHYAGLSCNMEQIMDIAQRKQLLVIEDAAQAVNAKYKEKYLGTVGHIGCFSFHGTKNFTSGEGGAILINDKNKKMWDFAEKIRQKGTNLSAFRRGEINRYHWVDIGSSYVPSDMLMAFLYAQLIELDEITHKRKELHDTYTNYLAKYVNEKVIRITKIPDYSASNYHIFYVMFKTEKMRDWVMQELIQRGIQATTHYEPLHNSPMGKRLGCNTAELPVTEKISKCILRLPMYTEMTKKEIKYVIENLQAILERAKDGC